MMEKISCINVIWEWDLESWSAHSGEHPGSKPVLDLEESDEAKGGEEVKEWQKANANNVEEDNMAEEDGGGLEEIDKKELRDRAEETDGSDCSTNSGSGAKGELFGDL